MITVPLLAGLVQLTPICPSPAVSTGAGGAPGRPTGSVVLGDQLLWSRVLLARTCTSVFVPLRSPVSVRVKPVELCSASMVTSPKSTSPAPIDITQKYELAGSGGVQASPKNRPVPSLAMSVHHKRLPCEAMLAAVGLDVA